MEQSKNLVILDSLYKWRITTFLGNISYILKEIKWFFQRGRRGYADCDVWNLFDYLLHILIYGISDLRETECGFPCGLDEDSQEAEKHWESILEEMIDGFEAGKELDDLIFDDEKYKEAKAKFDRAMELLHEYFFHLWD